MDTKTPTRTDAALAASIAHSKELDAELAKVRVALQTSDAHRAALVAALESIAQSDNPEHPVYGQNWHGSEAEFVRALQDEARAALARVRP